MPNAKRNYPEYEEMLLKKDVEAGVETTVTMTELSTKGNSDGWTDSDIARWTGVDLRRMIKE